MKLFQFNIIILFTFLSCFYVTWTFKQKCNKKCKENVPFYKDHFLILNTLNGKIRGSCKKVEINDPSNPNLSDYIISWKGIK